MRLFDVEDRVAAPPPPSVRVNGVVISEAAIAQEIQNHPAPSPMQAREAAATSLVVRELLLQEAQMRGISETPRDLGDGLRETEDDAQVRALLAEAVQLPSPTTGECRRYYEINVSRFQSPTIWEPAHILFSAPPQDDEARARVRDRAAGLVQVLRDNPEQFERLAREHSDCPSREQGGNLGQVSANQTTPAFEHALKSLRPGEMTHEPVETPYGFHIIRLDRQIDGATLPFSAVQQKIADYLADAVFHKAVHQYVALLAGQADIDGVDIEKATSPLMQ